MGSYCEPMSTAAIALAWFTWFWALLCSLIFDMSQFLVQDKDAWFGRRQVQILARLKGLLQLESCPWSFQACRNLFGYQSHRYSLTFFYCFSTSQFALEIPCFSWRFFLYVLSWTWQIYGTCIWSLGVLSSNSAIALYVSCFCFDSGTQSDMLISSVKTTWSNIPDYSWIDLASKFAAPNSKFTASLALSSIYLCQGP